MGACVWRIAALHLRRGVLTISAPVKVKTHCDTCPSQDPSITGDPASEVGGTERQSLVPFC